MFDLSPHKYSQMIQIISVIGFIGIMCTLLWLEKIIYEMPDWVLVLTFFIGLWIYVFVFYNVRRHL